MYTNEAIKPVFLSTDTFFAGGRQRWRGIPGMPGRMSGWGLVRGFGVAFFWGCAAAHCPRCPLRPLRPLRPLQGATAGGGVGRGRRGRCRRQNTRADDTPVPTVVQSWSSGVPGRRGGSAGAAVSAPALLANREIGGPGKATPRRLLELAGRKKWWTLQDSNL